MDLSEFIKNMKVKRLHPGMIMAGEGTKDDPWTCEKCGTPYTHDPKTGHTKLFNKMCLCPKCKASCREYRREHGIGPENRRKVVA